MEEISTLHLLSRPMNCKEVKKMKKKKLFIIIQIKKIHLYEIEYHPSFSYGNKEH